MRSSYENSSSSSIFAPRSLVNDKIAVGEAGKDFQKLARTVLETPEPAAKKAAAKVQETAEKVRLGTEQSFSC